jgi:hypothetical protein
MDRRLDDLTKGQKKKFISLGRPGAESDEESDR